MKLVPIALVALSSLVGCSDSSGVKRTVTRYPNGQHESQGALKDGKAEGRWTYWYASGQKRQEGEFKNDKEEGLWTFWNQDGSIDHDYSGIYRDGKRVAPLPKKK